jgi:hypothetical protein
LSAHSQLSDEILDAIPDGPDILPNDTVGDMCYMQEPDQCRNSE